ATDGTAWDCSGLDLDVTGTAILTLAGTIASGYIPQLTIDNISVGSSAAISGDEKGCENIGNGPGYGPNGSNICSINTAGYGQGNINNLRGAGGAGYGGAGGDGTSRTVYANASGDGGVAYGAGLVPTKFGSSGGGGGSAGKGGNGGGVIKIITGSITNDGIISVNGGAGISTEAARAGGGGSGGSLYILASGAINGSGTFSADGGDGADATTDNYSGGGGGGGRMHIEHSGGSFSFSNASVTATEGVGPELADDGTKGTAYVLNTSSDTATIYHGFTYDDTDISVTTLTMDSSATNQYCNSSAVSPSITAGTLNLGGSLLCNATNAPSLTSFNFSASSDFNVASATNFEISTRNADVDFNIPASDSQTWSGVTVATPPEGYFTIDDSVAITLSSGSAISGNVQWTNLTSLTLDNGTVIGANAKGCENIGNGPGYGPNGSNVCTLSTAGFGNGNFNNLRGTGGGGYGGDGGDGTTRTVYANASGDGGVTYGAGLAPTWFGSSGGSAWLTQAVGGSGGGVIKITTSGNITNNGVISVDGGNGGSVDPDRAGGGGSGGSLHILVSGTMDGTGSFSADGGNGADGATANYDGGGGGGGRIHIEHNGGTFSFSTSSVTATGGTGPDLADDGIKGTAYIKNTGSSAVTIYHGFIYDDTDFTVTTFTMDSSATNQTCGTSAVSPSISAGTFNGDGVLVCDATNAPSLTSFNFSASSDFNLASGTIFEIANRDADVDFNIPASNNQVWSGVTIQTPPEGYFTIDDNIAISLTNGTSITGNAQWINLTNLTVSSGTVLSADERGCIPVHNYIGYGPSPSNVCTANTAGYTTGTFNNSVGLAGAGHGGVGGIGTTLNRIVGAVYDSSANPVLFGSHGGSGGLLFALGGSGGGYINLILSGTLTNQGTISAKGGNGGNVDPDRAAGGGSGGSINITTNTYNCSGSGTLSVAGGDGADGATVGYDGGGGGGGMILVNYTTDSSSGCTLASLSAATVAAGGIGPDSAVDGDAGTLSLALVEAPPPEGSLNTIVVVTNSSPSVANVKICDDSADGSSCANSSTILPAIGADKNFDIFADVTDLNGFSDISSVSGVFYRSGVGSSCTPDKNQCYTLSCSVDAMDVGLETHRYLCDVAVAYWIDPTTGSADDYSAQNWVMSITVTDVSSAFNSNTNTTEVNELTSVSFPASVDFGGRTLGSDTNASQNQDLFSENLGNTDADLNARADAGTLTCSVDGSIPAGNIKFGNTDSDYASLITALTTSDQEIDLEVSPSDGALIVRTSESTSVSGYSHWGIEIPSSGVGGTCSGTTTITAFKDSI
ncbi:MAG: hypothetical protein Q8P30_00825, partial [Candidatus Uhrbacteria bacterium]|nr:hypothetical protein [Candidatus Uhrbacteria bacterium]